MEKPILEVVDWFSAVGKRALGGNVKITVEATDTSGAKVFTITEAFNFGSPLLDYIRQRVIDDGEYVVTAAKLIADYSAYTGIDYNVYPSAIGGYLMDYREMFSNAGLVATVTEKDNRNVWDFSLLPGYAESDVYLDNEDGEYYLQDDLVGVND